ncbi:hypothetical protein [Pseudomonas panipatensis]|uniref:Lipoprotein n=1 Tax=Pseudomonas panipatensis TaxID=428992 RepID=A0A1G8MNV5_9PSED|nr:hypothetical protein [Pseudomonas panipatensis]SDI69709.1 hypothetical protein SAMN05216272_11651 [Pseudomonas panipatensis]SMP77674.1 hypothetical protein SAMN06295951_11751 [Pseudomonas panipatensis]
MSHLSRLSIPALSLVALLAGCAGPMPKPDPSEAWVSLGEETPNVLMAEKLDGMNLSDGRFFEVPAGAHDLEVQLYDNSDSNAQEVCDATLRYDGFVPGARYHLQETSLGREFQARLYDAKGKQVAETDNFRCIPG